MCQAHEGLHEKSEYVQQVDERLCCAIMVVVVHFAMADDTICTHEPSVCTGTVTTRGLRSKILKLCEGRCIHKG